MALSQDPRDRSEILEEIIDLGSIGRHDAGRVVVVLVVEKLLRCMTYSILTGIFTYITVFGITKRFPLLSIRASDIKSAASEQRKSIKTPALISRLS